ncbi:MAG: GC-type dockerin domain-anchored protein [Phycisphaerales bacterium]
MGRGAGVVACAVLGAATLAFGQGVPRIGGLLGEPGVAPALVDVVGDSVRQELSARQIADLAAAVGGPVRIEGLALDLQRTVTLRVARFNATTPGARFEVVTERGVEALDFDPSGVVLLRGQVEGYPESRVYLGLGTRVSNGWIDLGPGAAATGQPRRYWVRGQGEAGAAIPGSMVLDVFPAVAPAVRAFGIDGGAGSGSGSGSGSGELGVALCGVEAGGAGGEFGSRARIAIPPAQPVAPAPAMGLTWDTPTILGLKQVEIAVETDHAYYQIFNDPIAAGEYIFELYGAISDIYIDEVRARVDVVYFRLWEVPDPYTSPSPLNQFRQTWNQTQQSVRRDVAQLLLGRRDLSAGGVAYLPGICNMSSYSWSGYVLGYFGSLDRRDDYSRDVGVAAHELGHNCGARHNHDYGIDTCQLSTTPARRGGLMSYCSQTVSGAGGNMDFRFETIVRDDIRALFADSACIADDCNLNGIDDETDITLGTSMDANSDGVPDECQDCNQNMVLDPIEISMGLVPDLNENGVPDGCEADCNGNGVPDDRDIALGTSLDEYLNGIPDECEPDCNQNGVSDYTDIRLDMTLDVDRDIIPDSCQDCDGDGLIDRFELAHSHHAWVGSLSAGILREFHSASGVRTGESADGIMENGDVLVTPDGRIFATSIGTSTILEFAADGTRLADLAGPGQGLDAPTFMALDASGDLLVSNRGTDEVLRFDLPSGAPMGAFVAAGAGGLFQPYGLALSPGGTLLVASNDHRVLEFNGQTGVFMRELVAAGSGGLSAPRGLCLLADGTLLAASSNTFELLAYDVGTGASLGTWQTVGNGAVLVLTEPWDVVVGPRGDVFASASGLGPESVGGGTAPLHVTTCRVFQFEASTGLFIKAYVVGNDTELFNASGIGFYPDFGTDCNANALPDNCDISSGRSADVNNNGVPDECECPADLTTGAIPGLFGYGVPNGLLSSDDFFYFLAQYAAGNLAVCDLTTGAVPGGPGYGQPNGVLNSDDFFFYLTLYAAGC